MSPIVSTPYGFAYLRGGAHPFSSGVVSEQGYYLRRVRLPPRTPLAEGLSRAASLLAARGLLLGALAACEIRAPKPLSFADFAGFNATYVAALRAHGFQAGPHFPIARSNLAPQFDPPSANTLFAFTFAMPNDSPRRDFVISGKPEISDASSPDGVPIIAPGDTSDAGLATKADFVFSDLRDKTERLGARWADATGAQIYTTHPLGPIIPILRKHGLADLGVTLFPSHPPVLGLDFEADIRAISREEG